MSLWQASWRLIFGSGTQTQDQSVNTDPIDLEQIHTQQPIPSSNKRSQKALAKQLGQKQANKGHQTKMYDTVFDARKEDKENISQNVGRGRHRLWPDDELDHVAPMRQAAQRKHLTDRKRPKLDADALLEE
jgi:hypothetical protein